MRVTRLRVIRLSAVVTVAIGATIAFQLASPASASSGPSAVAASSALTFGRAVAIHPPANGASGSTASLSSVSCPAKGDCAAAGEYIADRGISEAMVVTETQRRWHDAVELKLPGGASVEPNPVAAGIACIAAGDCVVVGYYLAGSRDEGFISTETRGTWARARKTPLPKNSGPGGSALDAVTCTGKGSCEAVGYYFDTHGHSHALAVSEVKGRWGSATAIGAPSSTLPGSGAFPEGISCAKAGDCFATGAYYNDKSDTTDYAAVGMVESRGTWKRGVEIKLPANAAAHDSTLYAVSCVRNGRCTAAGSYDKKSSSSSYAAFDVTESTGTPGGGAELTPEPPHGIDTALYGISCISATLCAAAGDYASTTAVQLALVMTWTGGKWHASGVQVPVNGEVRQRSYLDGLSCAASDYCVAVGAYYDLSGQLIPMVTTAS